MSAARHLPDALAPAELPALRRLPTSPRLASGELLWSYLQRLGHANNVDPEFLNEWILGLGVPGGWAACLATMTGKPKNSLREAIIDLVAPFDHDGARAMVVDRDDHVQVWQRRECLAGKQISEPARCWVPFHSKACVRHLRWLHPATDTSPPQAEEVIGLVALPEVVAAQQQLARLARRHPPEMLRRGVQEAHAVVIRWAATDNTDESGRWRRLDLLRGAGSKQRVLLDDPALPVALFPDTVNLAVVLADAHWRELATRPTDHPDHRALECELARRAGVLGFAPDSRHDPLNRWLRIQQTPGTDEGWLRPDHKPRWPNRRPATPPDPDHVGAPTTINIRGHRVGVLTAEYPVAGLRLFHLAQVVTFTCNGSCHQIRYGDWVAQTYFPPGTGKDKQWWSTPHYCRRCYRWKISHPDDPDDDNGNYHYDGPRTS